MEKRKYGLGFAASMLTLALLCLLAGPGKEADAGVEAAADTSAGQTDAAGETESVKAPIDLVLPRPMFVGTPQNIVVPNLEKPLGRPRPPFYAPVGAENIALGRLVTGSEEDPIIGSLNMITDGDKEAADGSYVHLGIGLQQVTIDLGAAYNIYAIVVWHYHQQARVYYDVVVQVSKDPDFLSDLHTVFNSDHDNSAGIGIGRDLHYSETWEGKLMDAKGVAGRYVRLYSNGNSQNDINSYIEVEVFGTPAK